MLRFEMEVAAADLAHRTIEGVVMPYNEVGRIGGVDYRFAPGSIRAARARPPLLVDHDRGQPVGVLAELVDGTEALLGRFRVDETPTGDMALIQAASGSRGSLSVGAEIVASAPGADGIVEVSEALLHEASLLALGAFASAAVTRVAAEADEPEQEPEQEPPGEPPPAEPHPDQTELPVEPADQPPEQEETAMTEVAAAAPMILAARADREPPALIAGELVALIVRAQHGEPDARRYLEAALLETISTDVSGLLPPQYETSVLGDKPTQRILYPIFRGKPLPGVGLAINKPRWTTLPDGQWAANVDADATSTKVTIGSDAANVERWDWAGAIPWVVVQRSDPSIIDAIYAAAVEDFYLDVETRIAALLTAATTAAEDSIGAGIAAFYAANGRNPEAIIVAPDVWGVMADAGALGNQVAAGGVSVGSGLTSSYAGLPITASASLPAGSRYLVTRRALDVRITEPVRLTANAIGALNVELAVVGEGLFDVDYAPEIMELTVATPVALAEQSSKGRGTK